VNGIDSQILKVGNFSFNPLKSVLKRSTYSIIPTIFHSNTNWDWKLDSNLVASDYWSDFQNGKPTNALMHQRIFLKWVIGVQLLE